MALGDLDRDAGANACARAGLKLRRLGRVEIEPSVAGRGAGRQRWRWPLRRWIGSVTGGR